MDTPRAGGVSHSHRHDERHHRNDDAGAAVHSSSMRKVVFFFNEIHLHGRTLEHAESAEGGMPY